MKDRNNSELGWIHSDLKQNRNELTAIHTGIFPSHSALGSSHLIVGGNQTGLATEPANVDKILDRMVRGQTGEGSGHFKEV